MRNFIIWFICLVLCIAYFHENPELIEKVKYIFKNDKVVVEGAEEGYISRSPANSFMLEFTKIISFSEKTAFITHDKDILDFNKENLKIYFQSGDLFYKSRLKKINLSQNFTTLKNGGIKNIFIYKGQEFAFASSFESGCYYASIILIDKKKEIFKTKCLPKKKIDFNGLGSAHIHHNKKILLTIGTPEQASSEIRKLAQDQNSFFGKIIEIDKNNLDQIIDGNKHEIIPKIYTLGHRNPQGMTKINDALFSVEHGPKGGDELNKIIKSKNYGWPRVSYGTQYVYEENGKSYEINHEKNFFEEPLFAFVPSVGISALNVCPSNLINYYNKACLLALSLHGNSLRPGRSIIIYLLNQKMDKVHSIEKIYLREDLKLRHFVTNQKNELYEDKEGNIYVSADKKGIYKLSFFGFRN